MIGDLLLTAPLAGFLAYGLLEARRSALIGLGIAALALGSLALTWLPGVALQLSMALGFAEVGALTALCWLGLTSLALVSVHVKLRRQMHVITVLARQLALSRHAADAGLAGRPGTERRTDADAVSASGGVAHGGPVPTKEVGSIVTLKPLPRRQGFAGSPGRREAAPMPPEEGAEGAEVAAGDPADDRVAARGTAR